MYAIVPCGRWYVGKCRRLAPNNFPGSCRLLVLTWGGGACEVGEQRLPLQACSPVVLDVGMPALFCSCSCGSLVWVQRFVMSERVEPKHLLQALGLVLAGNTKRTGPCVLALLCPAAHPIRGAPLHAM